MTSVIFLFLSLPGRLSHLEEEEDTRAGGLIKSFPGKLVGGVTIRD